jgi:hypothetical protein
MTEPENVGRTERQEIKWGETDGSKFRPSSCFQVGHFGSGVKQGHLRPLQQLESSPCKSDDALPIILGVAGMASWLTTHYPHLEVNAHPWHVYLQRQHKGAVTGIAKGDRVFFYEYKAQKPIKNGPKYPVGRQGIIRVSVVSGPMYHRDGKLEYSDGTFADWCWGVPTTEEDTDGFVGRAHVLAAIGYRAGGYLRGFNNGTGVMKLDDEQSSELLRLFKDGVNARGHRRDGRS